MFKTFIGELYIVDSSNELVPQKIEKEHEKAEASLDFVIFHFILTLRALCVFPIMMIFIL